MDRWLNNNSVVKVTSFLLALMLWVVVNHDPHPYSPGIGQAEVERQVHQVDLEVRYDERKFIVQAPSKVQVELRGSKDVLAMSSLLSPNGFKAYVDLRAYESGRYEVPVQYEGVPRGIEVTIQPSRVEVNIEAIKKLQKNVQVDVVGKPKGIAKVGAPVINPQTVTVIVPESRVKDVAFVRAVVSVEEAEGPIDTKVPLRVLDRKGQTLDVARVSPVAVDVHVPITSIPSKTVPLQVKTVGIPADGYRVTSTSINPQQITLYGPQEILDGISSYTLPDIDISGLQESKTVQMNLPLPDKIEKTDIQKAEVTVTISDMDKAAIAPQQPDSNQDSSTTSVRESVDVPIQVHGVTSRRTVEWINPSSGRIRLEVQGSKEAIENMNLTAYIDMSNKPPGEYTAQVRVSNLPPGAKLTNEPESLQATVVIKEANH
jgi:YbbR domain-containing protein